MGCRQKTVLIFFNNQFDLQDTVGCGWNCYKQYIFFTKNGKNLGVIPGVREPELFPVIGMDTNNTVHVNFGEEPFVFDLQQAEESASSFPVPGSVTPKEERDRHGFLAQVLLGPGGNFFQALLGYMNVGVEEGDGDFVYEEADDPPEGNDEGDDNDNDDDDDDYEYMSDESKSEEEQDEEMEGVWRNSKGDADEGDSGDD